MIAKTFSIEVTCPSCGELHTKKSRDWFIDKSTPFLTGEGYDYNCGCGQEVQFSLQSQQHGSVVRPLEELAF